MVDSIVRDAVGEETGDPSSKFGWRPENVQFEEEALVPYPVKGLFRVEEGCHCVSPFVFVGGDVLDGFEELVCGASSGTETRLAVWEDVVVFEEGAETFGDDLLEAFAQDGKQAYRSVVVGRCVSLPGFW